MSDFVIRFLTRPGCHLCDDARPLLNSAARRANATVVEVDVDQDDRLLAKYGIRIPVVLAPGDLVVAEGVIDDRRALVKTLRRLAAG